MVLLPFDTFMFTHRALERRTVRLGYELKGGGQRLQIEEKLSIPFDPQLDKINLADLDAALTGFQTPSKRTIMNAEKDTYLKFPCDFPIKAMGATKPGFRDQVVAIVGRHVPDVPDYAIRSTLSRTGKFLSVTVVITATSQIQLDNIYRELSACENVIMAL